MILLLALAAKVATVAAPAPPPVDVHALLAGADHAVDANRLDQASLMISRAVAGGASGAELNRVLANLAYAKGNYGQALGQYATLLRAAPNDETMLERAAIAALKVGQLDRADPLLKRATAKPSATWRVWNACGVAADLRRDWTEADKCYDQATRLAPREVEPVNNLGWSLLLRGDWNGALELFQRAVALDPNSGRAANNLELAKAALSAELPGRDPGESDASWAARLNDAGVAAMLLGDKARATAAFTQALDVSGTWYKRAANNLESVRGR